VQEDTFGSLLRQQLMILPILLPLLGAILVALIRGRWGGVAVLIISALTAVAAGRLLVLALQFGPQVYRAGNWAPPQGIVLVADTLSALLALVSSMLAVAAALYTLVSGEQVQRPFYHALFLFMLTALCGIFLTGDLFNLYVFMEMVILSSVILVAMANRPVSAEVTFKYTILSATGSTFLLFGIGLIYGGLGTLNMAHIAQRIQEAPAPVVVPVGATLMLGVFLLKAGAVPFHFWLPDAHSGAPSAVSAMLSGVLVKVGIYGILRLTTLLFPEHPWQLSLGILGAASALFGGLAALANTDLKRLLAYSTVANIGLILIAIGWGTAAGLMAAVVHMVNHALIKGSLFLAGGYLAERYDEHSLQRLMGFATHTPGIAVVIGLGAVALAGLPPTSGFVGKLVLIEAGWVGGEHLLLLCALLASALSIAYSMRLFVKLCWGATPEWVIVRSHQLGRQRFASLAAGLLAAVLLLLGLWPALLLSAASSSADEMLQPHLYIQAVLGEQP
jgi:multicomponent Na+:H+ antiporter subunit D